MPSRQASDLPSTAAAPKYAAADSSDARSAAHSKHLECAAPNLTEPFDTYTAARPNAFWALGERTSLCAAPPRNWSACTINPHYGNGLIMKSGDGTHRLTFFT